jgi:hypothetical protein
MVAGLFDLLRGPDRWLLIYDNAERPDRLAELLPPGGGGQVLVTSRWSAWGSRATPLRVNVLARNESVAFLGKRTGADDPVTLYALAELLGDLPLALEEAAAYLEESGVGVDEYLELVRKRMRELFALDQPPEEEDEHGDQRRVATVWSLSLDWVRREAPAAEALLSLCAFLSPEIPRALPREQPQVLPEELAKAVRDPLTYNRMLAGVGRYSLATVGATDRQPTSRPAPNQRRVATPLFHAVNRGSGLGPPDQPSADLVYPVTPQQPHALEAAAGFGVLGCRSTTARAEAGQGLPVWRWMTGPGDGGASPSIPV